MNYRKITVFIAVIFLCRISKRRVQGKAPKYILYVDACLIYERSGEHNYYHLKKNTKHKIKL